MRLSVLAAFAALAVTACATGGPSYPVSGGGAAAVPANIAAAVADSHRPPADRETDAERKPAESVAFAGVKPGAKVIDMIPGGGYFTRLFSKAVGTTGKVYAYVPDELTALAGGRAPTVAAVTNDPYYKANTVLIQRRMTQFGAPEKVDLVWTSRNYHDLHTKLMGPVDVAALNKRVYDALVPGGIYLVLDHAAAPGTGLSATDTLHRIDPATVKKEVTAAGFQFVGESDILRNPNDDHVGRNTETGIRGHTDQFIYKFRKPK